MVYRPVAPTRWSDPVVPTKFLLFPKLSSHSRKLLWLCNAVYIMREAITGGYSHFKIKWYSQKEYNWLKLRGEV